MKEKPIRATLWRFLTANLSVAAPRVSRQPLQQRGHIADKRPDSRRMPQQVMA